MQGYKKKILYGRIEISFIIYNNYAIAVFQG